MNRPNSFNRAGRLLGSVIAATLLSVVANATGTTGAIFVQTNESAGNKIAEYARATDGTLSWIGTVNTGGLGTGAGLGSQGSVVLSPDGKWLLAVNGGSNDVTVFGVTPTGLQWADRVYSRGLKPISLTIHDNTVYVLNAGGAPNVSGFKLGADGHLSAMLGSSRMIHNAGPVQVQFSPDGDLLMVSDKVAGKFDVFTMGFNEVADGDFVQNSVGAAPFGFAFGRRGRVYVSEAANGAVSSYFSDDDGALHVISPSVATNQVAACWVVATADGKYVYTANAGSGSITGFAVHADGSLTSLNADGKTGVVGAGSTVLDMTISSDGRYLYVLARGFGAVHEFAINSDGSLTSIGQIGGLNMTSATGIAGL